MVDTRADGSASESRWQFAARLALSLLLLALGLYVLSNYCPVSDI